MLLSAIARLTAVRKGQVKGLCCLTKAPQAALTLADARALTGAEMHLTPYLPHLVNEP